MFERNKLELELTNDEMFLVEELQELLELDSMPEVFHFALNYLLYPDDEAVDKINVAIDEAVTHPHEFPAMAEHFAIEIDDDLVDAPLTDLLAQRMIMALDEEQNFPTDIDEVAIYLIKLFDKSILKSPPKL